MRNSRKPILNTSDYLFRPHALDRFPLYFFMAACEACCHLGAQSMDWVEVPCSQSAGVQRQRSYDPDPIQSKICPHRWLTDKNGLPLYKYGFYVSLRTTAAWRVPLIGGVSPAVPEETSTTQEKGLYALYMMLLFRAHRSIDDMLYKVVGKIVFVILRMLF